MANKFKAGDIIKLKWGNHAMTVSGNAIKHTTAGNIPILDKYECFWMDGNKMQKAVFHEDVLKVC